MLRVRGLTSGYDGGTVLHAVDLDVPAGTVLAVVGRNGAGKSTLLHTVAGLLRPYSGVVEVCGARVAGLPAHRVARAGVGLVPQGRRVFPSLTVAEHLALAGGGRRSGPWTTARVLALLPRLGDRLRHRGDQLSGGEQQMLAIARALLTQPRVLLLDEPAEGLAIEVAGRVRDLVTALAADGLAVLLVEQQLPHAVEVADRIAVLGYGRVELRAEAAAVRADPAAVAALLTVAGPDGGAGPGGGAPPVAPNAPLPAAIPAPIPDVPSPRGY